MSDLNQLLGMPQPQGTRDPESDLIQKLLELAGSGVSSDLLDRGGSQASPIPTTADVTTTPQAQPAAPDLSSLLAEAEPLTTGQKVSAGLSDAIQQWISVKYGRPAPAVSAIDKIRANRQRVADRQTQVNITKEQFRQQGLGRDASAEQGRLGREAADARQTASSTAQAELARANNAFKEEQNRFDRALTREIEAGRRGDGLKPDKRQLDFGENLEEGIFQLVDGVQDPKDPQGSKPSLYERFRLEPDDPNYTNPEKVQREFMRQLSPSRGRGRRLTQEQRKNLAEMYNSEIRPIIAAFIEDRQRDSRNELLGIFNEGIQQGDQQDFEVGQQQRLLERQTLQKF